MRSKFQNAMLDSFIRVRKFKKQELEGEIENAKH